MTAFIGLITGFIVVAAALSLGGSAAAFINLSGILIVVMGTISVTAVSFSAEELRGLPGALRYLVFGGPKDPSQAARIALTIAERARKDGVRVIEKHMKAAVDPSLKHALMLIVDGIEPHEIEPILTRKAQAAAERHARTADILRRAGEVAPAMGLIGTLIGLVQMLGRLDDPSAIGPAMAVALLTTLYGAVLAHMVLLPLAAKADRAGEAESLVNSVYGLAASAISRKDNPRRLETLINSVLPPGKRVQFF